MNAFTGTFSTVGSTSLVRQVNKGAIFIIDLATESTLTGICVLERSLNGVCFTTVKTITTIDATTYTCDVDGYFYRLRCTYLGEAETFTYSLSVQNENVDIILKDPAGNAVVAACLTADIPTGAGCKRGCILIATDGTDQTNTLFVNIGDATTANFNLVTVASD